MNLPTSPRPCRGPTKCSCSVLACGVCHTDLHTVEGEIAGNLPVIPGHPIVGLADGERVGIPWLHSACGQCDFCRTDRENLCDCASFTGLHVNGGYAELAVARREFIVCIPDGFDDVHAAPLLCAGVIGYRALRKGGTLALAGIYMTPIPDFPDERLCHERTIRSVANATREDARQLMELAGKIPLRTEVRTFPLAEANRALLALKRNQIRGAGVLVVDS